VPKAQDYYPECPEAYLVSLARSGDRSAFAELVRRRQSQVRNLMRRCCGDPSLADDLAQQVFLKVWLTIRTLRRVTAFGAWLNQLAVSVWLQHLRKKDALRGAREFREVEPNQQNPDGLDWDLDRALATLSAHERLCLVLSYQEGMSHGEIARLTELPLGTVKSHINRGGHQLRQVLSAYTDRPGAERSS